MIILYSKDDRPIFIQFAVDLENNILKGIYAEESQIPSTTEVAVTLKINPATVNRGVSLLVDEGIIYKKRGIGMFVSPGAKNKIIEKRKKSFYESYIKTLITEAKNLNFTKNEILEMIERSFSDEYN
jgi:DNA-binding transcriptional regulator YhcF (GntR family)